MGYTIKQKIDICLKAETNPQMTQADLALWAKQEYGSSKPPSQTTISRILCAKNDLIASKEGDFQLVRRRKKSNPILRGILTEWVNQAMWENIPITTPIIQLTAKAIWNRLPTFEKDGNGVFNQKWCNHFFKKLNINLRGDEEDIRNNPGNYYLNKVWRLEDKILLKDYLVDLIKKENYKPQDIFTIDEFQLFYSLPLDQIFDVSSIDKGLKQSSCSTENSLTIMIGTNMDGSEKLSPLVVGKYDIFNVNASSHPAFRNLSVNTTSRQNIMNKITENFNVFYNSNLNKWITSGMFQNYLLTLDHKLSNTSPDRKILILLDDSSSHRILNLKFNNIRLCYIKNNANYKNPYNSSHSGSTFNFLPTSFGIIEEFKILYRLQQYLEMIKLQRKNSKTSADQDNKSPLKDFSSNDHKQNSSSSTAMEVLSESDYHIPLIKVIEWIKRAWDSITQEKIHLSWMKSHLFSIKKQWPSSNKEIARQASFSLRSLELALSNDDSSNNYNKLSEVMATLNVVIPWEITELLGLVNERGKITLSYVSIEEIIGSCLLEAYDSDESGKYKSSSSVNLVSDLNESWFKECNIDQNEATNILGKHFSRPIASTANNGNNGDIITSNTNMLTNDIIDYSDYAANSIGSMNVSPLLANSNGAIGHTHVTTVTNDQSDIHHPGCSVSSQGENNKESGPKSLGSTLHAVGDITRGSDISLLAMDSSSSLDGKQKNYNNHSYPRKRGKYMPASTSSNNSISNMYQNSRVPTTEKFNGTLLSQTNELAESSSKAISNSNSSSTKPSQNPDITEIPQLLSRLLEMAEKNQVNFTDNTVRELSFKLKEIQSNSSTG